MLDPATLSLEAINQRLCANALKVINDDLKVAFA
jgi:hypothetical protein